MRCILRTRSSSTAEGLEIGARGRCEYECKVEGAAETGAGEAGGGERRGDGSEKHGCGIEREG